MQLVIDGNTRNGHSVSDTSLPALALAVWIDSSKRIRLAAILSDGILILPKLLMNSFHNS